LAQAGSCPACSGKAKKHWAKLPKRKRGRKRKYNDGLTSRQRYRQRQDGTYKKTVLPDTAVGESVTRKAKPLPETLDKMYLTRADHSKLMGLYRSLARALMSSSVEWMIFGDTALSLARGHALLPWVGVVTLAMLETGWKAAASALDDAGLHYIWKGAGHYKVYADEGSRVPSVLGNRCVGTRSYTWPYADVLFCEGQRALRGHRLQSGVSPVHAVQL